MQTIHATPRAAAAAAFWNCEGNNQAAFDAAIDAYEAALAGLGDKQAQTLFVCSTVFAGGEPRHTVLIKNGDADPGRYYVVNKYLLAALKRGETPESLDLDPIEDDEDL